MLKLGKLFIGYFLVYDECFFGIGPSYVYLDFKEKLSGSDMSRGGQAN